jgi:peptidoglycan-N-acetylglucosamine deacetylase
MPLNHLVKSPRKLRRIALMLGAVALLAWFLLHPPAWLLDRAVTAVCPGAIAHLNAPKKHLFLTIDDAPSNDTAAILQVLDQYNVKATFFLISEQVQVQFSPTDSGDAVVRDLVQRGHKIGNHLTRDQPSIDLGDRFAAEMLAAKQVLDRYAPQQWLRPGGGWCTAAMASAAQVQGYRLALGSLWPYDTVITSPRFASWYILQNLRPGGIIILHDKGPQLQPPTSGQPTSGQPSQHQWSRNTALTLRKILPAIQAQGYTLGPLPQE